MTADIWGLLGPAARQQALYSGLLNLGGGLMAAGAPTTQPGYSARGLVAATQGFNQGINDAQQTGLRSLLVGQQLKESERAAAQRAMRESYINTLPPDQRARALAFPDQFGQSVFREPKPPQVVGPGGKLVQDGKEIFSNSDRPPPPSELAKLISERDALPPGHPSRTIYDAKIKTLTTREGDTGGPFRGTGMEAQALNFVLNPKADPNSPEYAAAYNHLTTPRYVMTESGPALMTPRLPPNIRQPGGATQPPPPSGSPAAGGQPGGRVTLEPLDVQGPTKKAKETYANAQAEAAAITASLNDFRESFAKAGIGERVKSITGASTPLNTSYNIATLLAKGDQLFQLGVLNGPDLEILRRTLPDPSTFMGQFGNANESVEKVVDLIQTRLNSYALKHNLEKTDIREFAKQASGKPPLKSKYGLD